MMHCCCLLLCYFFLGTECGVDGVALWLLKVGDNGVRDDTGELISANPLGLCEGDCDGKNFPATVNSLVTHL